MTEARFQRHKNFEIQLANAEADFVKLATGYFGSGNVMTFAEFQKAWLDKVAAYKAEYSADKTGVPTFDSAYIDVLSDKVPLLPFVKTDK
jgi:hypothetical protein